MDSILGAILGILSTETTGIPTEISYKYKQLSSYFSGFLSINSISY